MILRRWCRESSHNVFLKRHFQYLDWKRNRFNILHVRFAACCNSS